MSDAPPKPLLTLSIGVIGHRPDRLPKDPKALNKIAADVGLVLERLEAEAAIAQKAHKDFVAEAPPCLSLVSALAEGADRIAAAAGLARKWTLDVSLPFPTDVYRDDFKTDESKEAFDDLMRQARSVLVLPGEREDQTGAYESVGLTVLGQSDILLTIWDHGPSAGRGGTTEMLEAGVRLGVPIIYIDARGEEPPRILWSELIEFPTADASLNDLPVNELEKGLKIVVDKLVRPPIAEAERRALKRFLGERFYRYNARLEYPLLMALSGVRAIRKTDFRPPEPGVLASELLQLRPSASKGAIPSEPAVLALAYGWADAIGVRFAQVFRGAFITNFLLASVAVVVAVLSLLFDHHRKHIFVWVELGLIALVLINTLVGQWRIWHRRWLEPREIAERLRAALPLWMLGARPQSFIGQEPAWTGWYARAILREQSPLSGALDRDALSAAREVLLALLSGQCGYHEITASRMEQLEKRLEYFGLILFLLTALTAAVFLVINCFAAVEGEALETRAVIVTFLAAGLPALATASYGIRVIGDFDGIAHRSKRTHERLLKLAGAIEKDPVRLDRLRARARAAADAMLGDVSNWRISAESRRLNIPG